MIHAHYLSSVFNEYGLFTVNLYMVYIRVYI
jgi:hypothetical protein